MQRNDYVVSIGWALPLGCFIICFKCFYRKLDFGDNSKNEHMFLTVLSLCL